MMLCTKHQTGKVSFFLPMKSAHLRSSNPLGKGAPTTLRSSPTREDHLKSKSQCVYGRKRDCCSDNKKYFCKCNGMAGFRGTRLLIKGLWPRLHVPIFAKAPCCLALFGCCCRRLSQHGVGGMLIPLRHAGGMLSSVFAFAVDRFVTIGGRTAQCWFGLLMRCLFLGSPPSPQTPNAATLRVGLCMSPGVKG